MAGKEEVVVAEAVEVTDKTQQTTGTEAGSKLNVVLGPRLRSTFPRQCNNHTSRRLPEMLNLDSHRTRRMCRIQEGVEAAVVVVTGSC